MEEIKKAYRELVKKYHPDRYDDNPLKDLADEKMREINEAYDYLTKNKPQGNDFRRNREEYNYNSSSSSYSGGSSCSRVRECIDMNDMLSAERELNQVTDRGAEWFYLKGIINMRKGWYSEGYNDIQRAAQMDPSNYEYREALNRIMNQNRNYGNYSYTRRGPASNDDMCSMCTCLCCADQFCECMGGDLVPCC